MTPLKLIVILGLLAISAALVLNMSGSAPRIADTNHVSDPVFAASVPGGGKACQPISGAPNVIGAVRLLVGSYGRPLPAMNLHITGAQNQLLAVGELRAGATEGYVSVPVRRVGDLGRATEMCLQIGGSGYFVLGGEAGPAGAEVVNGKPEPGNISLTYMRRGSESWWQLLPTLDTRFGLGKASIFGAWTLPAASLLLLAVWIATIRLITREFE